LHRHMTHLTRRVGACPELVAHREASAAAKQNLIQLIKSGQADAAEAHWRDYLLIQRDRVAELTGGPHALMEYYAKDYPPLDPAAEKSPD
jgi:protein-disulfide isomerase-like protein with CxxC motif